MVSRSVLPTATSSAPAPSKPLSLTKLSTSTKPSSISSPLASPRPLPPPPPAWISSLAALGSGARLSWPMPQLASLSRARSIASSAGARALATCARFLPSATSRCICSETRRVTLVVGILLGVRSRRFTRVSISSSSSMGTDDVVAALAWRCCLMMSSRRVCRMEILRWMRRGYLSTLDARLERRVPSASSLASSESWIGASSAAAGASKSSSSASRPASSGKRLARSWSVEVHICARDTSSGLARRFLTEKILACSMMLRVGASGSAPMMSHSSFFTRRMRTPCTPPSSGGVVSSPMAAAAAASAAAWAAAAASAAASPSGSGLSAISSGKMAASLARETTQTCASLTSSGLVRTFFTQKTRASSMMARVGRSGLAPMMLHSCFFTPFMRASWTLPWGPGGPRSGLAAGAGAGGASMGSASSTSSFRMPRRDARSTRVLVHVCARRTSSGCVRRFLTHQMRDSSMTLRVGVLGLMLMMLHRSFFTPWRRTLCTESLGSLAASPST
mmetsp:Transcript_3604/g.14180  ORF Transcript_3604/g.14180 Transcript_3604/m.14180 type:complete len:506 (-) Transcript_3604:71-1588(-)